MLFPRLAPALVGADDREHGSRVAVVASDKAAWRWATLVLGSLSGWTARRFVTRAIV
jgi:hypothetical protein